MCISTIKLKVRPLQMSGLALWIDGSDIIAVRLLSHAHLQKG